METEVEGHTRHIKTNDKAPAVTWGRHEGGNVDREIY